MTKKKTQNEKKWVQIFTLMVSLFFIGASQNEITYFIVGILIGMIALIGSLMDVYTK